LGGAALAVVGMQLTPSESAQRTVLSENELGAIVGGIAASTISIGFPETFIKSDFAASDSKWNQAGNRCQFPCTSGSEPNKGATNVGFNVFTAIALPDGIQSDGPFLEVYNNGQGRARTEANEVTVVDAGQFSIYTASLKTICVGGTAPANTHCNLDTECPGTGARCATCDHNGVCNNGPTSLAPCATRCVGGSRNGKICECITGCTLDCPGSGSTCEAAIESGAQTCYLLGGCGEHFVSGSCIQDCTETGSVVDGVSGDIYEEGPMHSALFRVTFFVPDGPDAGSFPDEVQVDSEESIYRVADRNGSNSNCQGAAE
jgi:hypothetical protein